MPFRNLFSIFTASLLFSGWGAPPLNPQARATELLSQGAFKEALAQAKEIEDTCQRNIFFETAAINFAEEIEIELALCFLRAIDVNDYHASTVSQIVENLCEAGFFEDAVTIAKESRKDNDYLVDMITEGLCKVGKYEQAITIAKALSSEEEQDSTLVSVIIALSDAKQFREAEKWLPSILDEETASLLKAYLLLEEGKFEEAKAAIAPFTEYEKEFTHLLLLKQGLFREALDLADTLSEEERGYAYSAIAEAFAKAGNLEAALTTVDKISDPGTKSYSLQDVATVLAADGDLETALEIAEMSKNGCYWVSRALTDLNKVEESLFFVDEIEDPFRYNNALIYLSNTLILNRQFTKAREVVEKVSEKGLKERAFKRIAKAESR